MNTILIKTPDPNNPKLISACLELEAAGHKIFIEPLDKPLEENNWFTVLIMELDKVPDYMMVNCSNWKFAITNSLSLIEPLLNYGFDKVYIDWDNFIHNYLFK